MSNIHQYVFNANIEGFKLQCDRTIGRNTENHIEREREREENILVINGCLYSTCCAASAAMLHNKTLDNELSLDACFAY